MSSATILAEKPNYASTGKTQQFSACETQEENRQVRNWVIGTIVFEVVFLGTVAAYIFSSMHWYQNCL